MGLSAFGVEDDRIISKAGAHSYEAQGRTTRGMRYSAPRRAAEEFAEKVKTGAKNVKTGAENVKAAARLRPYSAGAVIGAPVGLTAGAALRRKRKTED